MITLPSFSVARDKLPKGGRFAAEKPKKYRTFLFFGPQNQLKRENTRRNFLNLSVNKRVLKSLSFTYKIKVLFHFKFARGGGEIHLILVIWTRNVNVV